MNFTELRDSVANSEVNLANVLRQTKIFAYRLGETSFKQWVEYELKPSMLPSKATITSSQVGATLASPSIRLSPLTTLMPSCELHVTFKSQMTMLRISRMPSKPIKPQSRKSLDPKLKSGSGRQ
jgi:hypothetical protein